MRAAAFIKCLPARGAQCRLQWKKKQHTLKNTVMALPTKFIVFLGRTFSGHNHDYLMLKQEFPPELDWFTEMNVRVD